LAGHSATHWIWALGFAKFSKEKKKKKRVNEISLNNDLKKNNIHAACSTMTAFNSVTTPLEFLITSVHRITDAFWSPTSPLGINLILLYFIDDFWIEKSKKKKKKTF